MSYPTITIMIRPVRLFTLENQAELAYLLPNGIFLLDPESPQFYESLPSRYSRHWEYCGRHFLISIDGFRDIASRAKYVPGSIRAILQAPLQEVHR